MKIVIFRHSFGRFIRNSSYYQISLPMLSEFERTDWLLFTLKSSKYQGFLMIPGNSFIFKKCLKWNLAIPKYWHKNSKLGNAFKLKVLKLFGTITST